MPRFLAIVVAGVALSFSSKTAMADPLSFGAGVAVSGEYDGFGAPDPAGLTLPQSGDEVTLPGFSGIGYGAGIALELRLFEVVGVEANAFYTRESMSGDVERGDSTVEVTLSHPAFRVPILVKGVLPLPVIAPFAELGPELVIFGLSDASVDPSSGLRAVASAESGVWIVGGAGVEIRVPAPGVDLRFPIALRLSVNPSSKSSLGDRATALPTDAVVLDSTPDATLALVGGARLFF